MERRNTDSGAERFFGAETRWKSELEALREIMLAAGLEETLKWGKPCYALGGANVALLYSFKETCAAGFFKGALLTDPEGILEKPGEHSQAMRMAKFKSLPEIEEKKAALGACLAEAVLAERTGRRVAFTEKAEAALPEEFLRRLEDSPELKASFGALTPGRRRAYALYFSEPKQSKTREARVEKYLPKILAGKGMGD